MYEADFGWDTIPQIEKVGCKVSATRNKCPEIKRNGT
jgi:hypothetical protein